METFMTILFVLSIALVLGASIFLTIGLLFVIEQKSIENRDIWLSLICLVTGFGGYIAATNIDDYQATMKVEQFKATCLLEGSEGRFDAIKKNVIVKIDSEIEVELTGTDWTLRIGDEMLNAASLPKCAELSK